MTAQEKILEFYKMADVLRKRNVRACDIVMTSDVSMLLMTDIDFLDFYNKLQVRTGLIDQEELPEGVVRNGTINVQGLIFTMYTYDCIYEDLDGTQKELLPKGTIAFLHPNIGETVYAQVTFVNGTGFQSYAERIVPRLVADEKENMVSVETFSRPVPYPYDWDSWLVANIYDPIARDQKEADNAVDTNEPALDNVELKFEEEIRAFTKKADAISYAETIGLSGLTTDMSLEDIKNAIIQYQDEKYGD